MTDAKPSAADPGLRPRPSTNLDNQFFWDGAAKHELRIQTCDRCASKYFPPTPRCWHCGSYELGWTVASGRASLYSWAIPHHPQAEGFDYPLIVGLVELEEGTRLVTNIVNCERDELRVGLPLQVTWLECKPPDGADDFILPQFQPQPSSTREQE